MAHDSDQFITAGVLREHRFASHTPVLGRLIARLRSAWYNVAARWGDQSIIDQQTAFNRMAAQQINVFDQRLILTDRDLTDLVSTVAELTDQVIQLQRLVAVLQARADQPPDQRE